MRRFILFLASLSAVWAADPNWIAEKGGVLLRDNTGKITGVDLPPNGSIHARFSPDGDQLDGRFVSVDRPSRPGPRHSGQSLAATTAMPADAAKTRERSRMRMKSIIGVPRPSHQ